MISIIVVLVLVGEGGTADAQSRINDARPDGSATADQTIFTKSVNRATASSGDTLIYTLSFEYEGEELLQDVSITDEVPIGTSYVSGSASAGGVESGGSVTWKFEGNVEGIPGKAYGPASLEMYSTINVAPTLVSSGDLITVKMRLSANTTVSGVVPEMLFRGYDGVRAIPVNGPIPSSATVGPSGTTFVWIYRAWSSGADDPLAGLVAIDGPQSQPVPSQVVSVGPDHVYKDTDFAYASPSKDLAILGDSVWYDANGDGYKQDSEPGIPGVEVVARDGGGGTYTAVTDVTGRYLIEVPPGFYNLAVSNYSTSLDKSTPTSYETGLLLPDEYYLQADFGYTDSTGGIFGNIGNLLFEDANKNGVFEPSETPIAGVSVDLIKDNDGDGLWDPGEPIIATTTTTSWLDADSGNYQFSGLVEGSYLVHVSDTNAILIDYKSSAVLTDPYAINLPAGASNLTADFAFYQEGQLASALGDFVWYDANRNGIQDVAEPGIGNVVLDLYLDADASGNLTSADRLVDSTVTDIDGGYLFRGLSAGKYLVDVADGAGQLPFIGSAQSEGLNWPTAQSNSTLVIPPLIFDVTVDDPAEVSLVQNTAHFSEGGGSLPVIASNTVYTTIGGRIGDTVWDDQDGDGIRDGDEPGIPGVIIELTLAGGGVSMTTTDANGSFEFVGLSAGSYTITFDETSVSDDYALITTPYPQLVDLGGSETYTAADIGIKGMATAVGDSLWYDADADGLHDVGEPGIGNVTVDLYYDNDGNGSFNPSYDIVVDSTVSDALGAYRLDVPASGDYFIDVTDDYDILDGMSHTIGAQSMWEPSPPISMITGDIYRDADFGYVRVPLNGYAIISGKVWLDGNSNQFCDQSEPVLLDIEVCAVSTNGGASVCTVTDLNGRYLLEVPSGAYEITPVSPPPGLTPTTPAPLTLTVGAGEQNLSANFGYIGQQQVMSGIGGEIWQDIPVNDVVDGIFDHQNEPGIGNVTVNLVRDTNGDGVWQAGEPILATLSNSDGGYYYRHLLAGDYIVEVSDSYLVLRYFDVTEPGPAPDADDNNHPQPYAVHLRQGEVRNTIDFGYREYDAIGTSSANPGLIGDQVWLDVNDDGIFNPDQGDQPISGVTVRLSQGGSLIATTTTGADGRYVFTDLLPGSYSVDVTDEFGVLSDYITAAPGPTSGQDNNNQSQPYNVTLGFNPVNMTADFGYRWLDASYTITKDFNSRNPSRTDEIVEFSTKITNTGQGWIAVLPLQDVYNPSYLEFRDATPMPDDDNNDGQLDWGDLTTLFGDLAPGASVEILVNFKAIRDTTQLPEGSTLNTGTVVSALIDPDGIGPLGAIAPLGEASASQNVQIFAPTGLQMAGFEADAGPNGVHLSWQTVSELDMVGFVLMRGTAPLARDAGGVGFIPLHDGLIIAERTGLDDGGSYIFLDENGTPGAAYWYALGVVDVAGDVEYFGMDHAVTTFWRIFNPWVTGN